MYNLQYAQSVINNINLSNPSLCVDITLVPSIFERSSKYLFTENSLKTTSDLLGILKYGKLQKSLE
jgi:hypothetical protein